MTKVIKPEIWNKMTNQQREDFLRRPDLYAPGSGDLVTFGKSMTDRDRLAEKLFIDRMNRSGLEPAENKALIAISAANKFFDTLEGNNNEDE